MKQGFVSSLAICAGCPGIRAVFHRLFHIETCFDHCPGAGDGRVRDFALGDAEDEAAAAGTVVAIVDRAVAFELVEATRDDASEELAVPGGEPIP